jgi:hypothetical protein
MSVKVALASALVLAAGSLVLAGSASAQFTGQVKVSNVIEGTGKPSGVSAVRCGTNIVVGFADTEPNSTGSNAGFSVSKNGGASFSDLGALSDPSLRFGGGDSPVLACSNSSTFYYATLAVSSDINAGCAGGCSEVSVSSSTSGGSTWHAPVVASGGTFDIYQFQSPALAIDPNNPKRLYAAYINHNFAGPNDYPNCDDSDEYVLEVVTSGDGGKTWDGRANPGDRGSPNMQPDHTCTGTSLDARHTGTLAAPSVIVSPTGQVYVAYEFVGVSANGVPAAPNEIRFTRSVNDGASFSAPLTVSKDAINNALPELAVDRTSLRSRGTVYLTWSGTPTGTYTDVLVSDSVNFGLSFSFPRPISPAPAAGTGRFQASPVIAVDNDGFVAACFYETPHNQPTSSSVYSYNCAGSFNHGASWQQQRIAASVPAGYDAVTADFLLHTDGFFSAYEISSSGRRFVVGRSGDAN